MSSHPRFVFDNATEQRTAAKAKDEANTNEKKKTARKSHKKEGGRRRSGEASVLRSYNDERIIIMMR